MTAMNTPRFSVVMPAYNAEQYVGEAIESVLAQTMPSWELLVVNDCSTDRTLEVCRSFHDPRIRIFSSAQNLNAAGARNMALEHARGEFVAFLDSDDLAVPDRLERQLKAFRAEPELGFLGSQIEFFGGRQDAADKPPIFPERDSHIKAEMLFRCPFLMSTVSIRSRLLSNLEDQAFCPEYAPCEDYYFGVRLIGLCRFRNEAQPVSQYRLHASQLNVLQRDFMSMQIANVQKYLLEHIGLEMPNKNVEIHHKCCIGKVLSFDDVDATGGWLEAIYRANLEKKIIPEVGIRFALGARWFGLCKSCDERRMALFQKFISKTVSKFYQSRRDKLKFFSACLIGLRIN